MSNADSGGAAMKRSSENTGKHHIPDVVTNGEKEELINALIAHFADLGSASWGRGYSIDKPHEREKLAILLVDRLFTPVLSRVALAREDGARGLQEPRTSHEPPSGPIGALNGHQAPTGPFLTEQRAHQALRDAPHYVYRDELPGIDGYFISQGYARCVHCNDMTRYVKQETSERQCPTCIANG